MTRKTTQLAICCFVLSSLSFINVSAQRLKSTPQSRTFAGNIFLGIPAPQTPVASDATATQRAADDISSATAPVRSPNRSIDGKNNNLTDGRTNWGAANIPLFREMPAVYGSSDPNNAMGGAGRPSARRVSNVVSDEPETIFNARGLSTFVYIWGQFLDHDITLTPTGTTESVPIPLPADDSIFTEAIPFHRSAVFPGTGVNGIPRNQFNLNTAWVDASPIYGSDITTANWLRTFRNGKMKTSSGNLLPWNTVTGQFGAAIDPNAPSMANDGNKTIKTFAAGDVRAAEHPDLTALHTLFVREHNRICDVLVSRGMRNDEQIYQLARKKVGALIQAVTYNEFLPALGINIVPMHGYNASRRSDITNIFATAGYRLGHTMVADEVLLFDNNCQPIDPESLELDEIFWTPSLIAEFGVEPFFKGSVSHTQYETNTKINSILRNFLFNSPSDPTRFGIDLASLNIQRGRDHGLPNYNAVRRFYTGSGARTFADINSDPVQQANLRGLYGNVNNIDLWTGVLAEDLVGGTSVGKLVQSILKVQFENLRDGDFYFFEFDPFLPTEDRNEARNSHLSDIIKRNTSLTNLPGNLFFTLACPGFTPTPAITIPVNTLTQSVLPTVKLYPNPTVSKVTIALENPAEAGTIQVFSPNGVLVKTIVTAAHQQNAEINVSSLPRGVYTIAVRNNKKTASFKVVKM